MLTLNPSLYLAQAIRHGDAARLRLRHRAEWGDAPPLRRGFRADWGRTGIFVAHAARWDDKPWQKARLASPWDILYRRGWHHQAVWTLPFHLRHSSVFSIRMARAATHPYGDMRQHAASVRLLWRLTAQARAAHAAAWDVKTTDPVARRHETSWALLDDARIQMVANTPELVWNGRTIRIAGAVLSCDEDSPVWLARIALASLADFAGIAIGDALTLQLGLETFNLVVDGKTLSRPSPAERQMELTASSPLILKDAPFAAAISYHGTGAVRARSAVESLLGPVSWQLPDWIVPAGRIAFEHVTPLSAARVIVAAIGGLIESAPDGSIICRRRHPVSIPDYGRATADHSLFDAEVIAVRAQIAPSRGYSRVVIANEDGQTASNPDRIEYLADPGNPSQGTVRAHLGRDRPVTLVHTGHPATVIASLGAVTRTESETVEFIAGQASTRYPVQAIEAVAWQHADLGAVSASGQTLTAATPGYSLARVSYATTSRDWRVALAASEEVQFVLMDV